MTTSPPRRVAYGIVLTAAIGYAVVGLVTAALAARDATIHGKTTWRLTAWVLSLAIFAIHLATTRRLRRTSVSMGAFEVALAVALGALVLAALGPVRSHWNDAQLLRTAALSLVAWPLLTGLPSFIAALLGGYIIERARKST